MSLRLQITAVYGAILVVTMAVAASLGQSIARKAVEQASRERAVDLARSIVADLDLSPREVARLEPPELEDRFEQAVPLHRGLRRAELAVLLGARRQLVRIDVATGGFQVSAGEPPPQLAAAPSSAVLREDEERIAEVVLPLAGKDRKPWANLRIELDLTDAAALVREERRVFLWVTIASAVVLALSFSVILGRLLARPLQQLAAAMARVESGALDGAPIPGAGRVDEIGVVARGLAQMLDRLRDFNQELQRRIEEATAALAAKNRALADANLALVAARRDLDAKERLAALGQISGTIAHELGNPLNAISGHVQLVARSPACPPEIREQIAIVGREAQRMTAIIRRFLDSARAMTPAPEPVDLATLVDDVLSLSIPAPLRERIEVLRDVAPEVARVALDPALVRHVLGNFVSNALDAMAGAGRLEVRARAADGGVAIAVSDTGPGLRPEDRKRVFEPFYTTKPAGQGSGLGLAISREIASALRGRIDVESEPGAGATFTLHVPLPAAGEQGWMRRSSG